MKNEGVRLVQIGMRAGMMKDYLLVFLINTVNENPVRFNMTSHPALVVSVQRVVFVLGQQRLFINKQCHYFGKFIHILAALFHQLAFSFIRTVKNGSQHGLIVQIVRVVPIKVFQHLLKGIETAQCGRYLARQHIINFLHTRVNLRLKERISRHRIAVRGAERTFPDIRGGGFRDGIGRHVVSVRNTHADSIA